ncbi:hypothetical protein BBF96_13290 [Anoxybacter fermentans]|uniref:DUF4446 domain-containing protein n=1 Tax=Anoxybacter fermentans TaxID=1323375 RepID=A0A3S9T191_9FIRM|nr:DUF4446 family protein [Anoxybacter fermentans]AZR74290.1 hypothetical protein BBF96_13290 [Anoxybacter fermentans]
MQEFMNKLQTDLLFFIQIGMLVVLFILVIINSIRISRLKKKLKQITHNQDGKNIETIIKDYYGDIDKVKETQAKILTKQQEIAAILQRCITKVGMVRFNPFKDMGGDQSFAIALLDRENNGIVISSLYGRTNSRFYGKPIIKGQSSYTLSEEEKEAIRRAIAGKIDQ